jgi:ketosteroid isomerase-like protein
LSGEDLAALLRRFLRAYGDGDLAAVRAGLGDDLVAYVTNADGGADLVEGAERYLERLPDLRAAGGTIEVTQTLEVNTELVLAMIEIRAERGGRELHNFASLLARIADGRIATLWMVEAQPAHSNEFWS